MLKLQKHVPLLVGNGQIEGQGKLIDEFSLIIRINNFKIRGYEKHVGSKLHIAAAQWMFLGPEYSAASQVWWINCSAWCYKSKQWSASYAAIPANKLQTFIADQPIFAAHLLKLRHELNSIARAANPTATKIDVAPSAGMCLILYMLQMYRKIAIIGFDFGKTGHYYNPKHTHWPGHNWTWEKTYIEPLIAASRVIKLPNSNKEKPRSDAYDLYQDW